MCPTDYSTEPPLWTGGPSSEALSLHAQVVGLNLKGAVAYPMPALAQRQVVNDVVDGKDVALFSTQPCAGSLGATTADTSSVYSPLVGERRLSFTRRKVKSSTERPAARGAQGSWRSGLGDHVAGPMVQQPSGLERYGLGTRWAADMAERTGGHVPRLLCVPRRIYLVYRPGEPGASRAELETTQF